MYNFDWTSVIRINLRVLRCVGLWPEKDKSYELNLYTFYSILMATVIIAGHNFSQIMNVRFVYQDVEVLTATIFILITNILAMAKMCLFVWNLKTFKHLLRTTNSFQFQPKSSNQIRLIRPSLRRWRLSYTVYHAIVAVNLIMWNIGPVLNENQMLPFASWYPFSVSRTPFYEIVYFYQTVCIWCVTAANLNVDCFIYALLMYIWSQCDLLCDDLSNISGDSDEFGYKLMNCIKHHKNILRFAKQSNALVSVIILGQFATSTLVLAMTMFRLSLSDPLSGESFTHLNYILGISVQLFVYCWFGNEVEFKSSQIPYALFKSLWIGQPTTITRSVLIMSMKCQQPIKITAINLFALSLSTFVAILRMAWSYFAVLNKVSGSRVPH